MKQLSGVDAAFLYLETPSTPMHTMAMLVLDAGAPQISLETIQALLVDRMHRLPSLGQRLLECPLGLDRPMLVDDPTFDIENHVVQDTSKSAFTLDDLDRAAGVLASRPLDRSRPLWEAWFFEGVDGDGSAIIFKFHHSIIDGVSAALFMAQLLDTEPNLTPSHHLSTVRTMDDAPGRGVLIRRALWNQATQPLRVARTALGVVRGAREWWSEREDQGRTQAPSWPVPLAPRTELDGVLSTKRQVVRGSVPLDDFRFIKKAFDTTVNNVLLAACTIALRRHLAAGGSVPSRPLVASVPVSTRVGDSELGGNQVSNMLVRLPVQLECPREIVRFVEQEVREARRTHDVVGSKLLGPTLDVLAPPAFRWVARQHQRWGLSNFHPPVCNIVISNIAGPPIPLYCGGVYVRAAYPFGPLMNGTGLNLTVLSYSGRMDFGLITCPLRTPDAEGLMAEFQDAVGSLRETAEGLGRRSLPPSGSVSGRDATLPAIGPKAPVFKPRKVAAKRVAGNLVKRSKSKSGAVSIELVPRRS